MCTESNGASFINLLITSPVLYMQVDILFENVHTLIKFSIKLYVSEQLFAPIMMVYILLQLHKHSMSI